MFQLGKEDLKKDTRTITIAAASSAAASNVIGNMYRSNAVTWTYPVKFFREFSPTSATAKGVKLTAWGTWK